MKIRSFLTRRVTRFCAILGFISALAFSASAAPSLIVTEINSNAAGGDFWELTNAGDAAQDIGNWKWDDDSANPNDAAAVTIPSGTSIAPGESIVFTTAASLEAFQTAWGALAGVQVIVSPSGPGFGQNDQVHLFDAGGASVTSFNYAAGGFTKSDGAASLGGHAGASAGGAAAQSAVIDPAFGTGAGRRFMAATAGMHGAYANSSGGLNIGSPGVTGITFGGGPGITLTLDISPATFSESAANPAATGTVSRATSGTTDLVVSLSSSDPTEATVPATVTILANQTSATFDVTAVDDTFPDGDKTVTITATADDATTPTFEITVEDDGDVPDTSFLLTEIQSNQSSGSPGNSEDYWELTNIGGVSRDIGGYTWHDSGRSAGSAQAYKLPAGTMIGPGESVVFTAMPAADFRAWWGLDGSAQVFQSVGAPGLGQGDGISFFDAGGNELFFFSYAAGGFTREDGSASTGGHAGPSAGGSEASQALIWVPSSGTVAPRYTFATGANHGSFQAVAPATDKGSPGSQGVTVPGVSISDPSVPEGDSGSEALTFVVTRSDTDTAFTVDYAITGGTATSGTDYTPLASGTLTFTAGGAAAQDITVTVLGDTDSEPDETVIVTLSNVVNTTGGTEIQKATGTGAIVNDDSIAPSFILHPAGTTIGAGAGTTLTAGADGFPEPSYQWYEGQSGDTTSPVGGATAPVFVTPALNATTSYWVRASNGGGSADSDTAVITVVPGPASIDLSTYVRVGRYDLPEYRRTPLPAGTASHNLLADEASGVAYNWDTDTLFICGDGGRSITQVTKTGQLIDTMSLALNPANPQGVEFYDPEGITYIGNGEFVFCEERERRLVKFTYVPGATLTRAAAQTVDIGTFDDNTGTEGLSFDPLTSGFIVLKEKNPIGVFQTGVDFAAGTATNGSASTVNSANLFDTTLLGMTDVADVFALSNLPSMSGQPQEADLLIVGQEDARIVHVDRDGNLKGTLQIVSDIGNPLSAADQQHEGITMDRAGNLYIVNENGGGSIEYPQLWVYAPSTLPNQPPTAIVLNNEVNSIEENSSTASPVKLGDIVVVDDGLGTNDLSLSGADAASFEITGGSFYLKAGVILDFETKASYSVTIEADDTTVGATPDATLAFTLTVLDQEPETPPAPVVLITEVAPWSSGDSAVGADWFELTNVSSAAIDITGWKVDDSSASFGSAAVLNGVTTLAPGESAIFIETSDLPGKTAAFLGNWFGGSPPASFQIGSYSGGGLGLSTSGDGVNIFNAAGVLQASVSFGASPSGPVFATFDNTAGLNAATISQLSVIGTNGAFAAAANANEVGSPGYAAPGILRVTEVAPWSSGNSPVGADWFEVTNVGARAVDITGWKMDDSSESPAAAVPLAGITSIAPGESVIFLESANLSAISSAFLNNWFGGAAPAGLQIGTYSGSGVGLSTGGDAVNLYDTNNVRVASVSFGLAPSVAPFATFDNSAALNVAAITTFSAVGVNGAFQAVASTTTEIGSPGGIAPVSVEFSAPVHTAAQGDGSVQLTLTRSGGTGAASVALSTADGAESVVPPFSPAVAGTHYEALSGFMVSFAPGQMSRTVDVTLLPEPGANRQNRRFTVSIASGIGGVTPGAQASASVEILATDTRAPTLTVSTPSASTTAISAAAPYLVTGTAGDTLGLERVMIRLNGGTAFEAALGSATRPQSVPFSAAITPQPGANTLEVTAYDLSGNSTVVTRVFSFVLRRTLGLVRDVPAAQAATPDAAGTLMLTADPGAAATAPAPRYAASQSSAIVPGVLVTLTARPKSGFLFSHWSGLPAGAAVSSTSAAFTMPDADVTAVTAVFIDNPFAGLAARVDFTGLILPESGTTIENDTRALVTTRLTTASGSLSGKVLIGGGSQSFTGSVLGDGSVWFRVSGVISPALDFDGKSLSLTLSGGVFQAQLTQAAGPGGGILRPALYSSASPVPAALLNRPRRAGDPVNQGYLTVALAAREQTPPLAASAYPQGSGQAIAIIESSGAVKFTGTLADGTRFTASSMLVTGDEAPFLAAFTKPAPGSLSGSLVFDATQADTDATAQDLAWFRAASAAAPYAAGWPQGIQPDLFGALYDAALDAQTALALGATDPVNGNARLLLEAGKLASTVSPAFNISASTFSKLDVKDRSHSLSLTQRTGFFSGKFTPDWTPAARAQPGFKGVLLQKGALRAGYGSFLSNIPGDTAPESGSVVLEAVPAALP